MSRSESERPSAANPRRGLLLRAGVALVLMILVLQLVDLEAALTLLHQAAPGPLLGAVGLYALMYAVKSTRWRGLLATQQFVLPRLQALYIYLWSSLIGAFTPGRIGEASRIWGPARDNRRFSESLACTAVDKAFDVGLLVALLALASCSPLLLPGEVVSLRLVAAVAIMAAGLGLMLLRTLVRPDCRLTDQLLARLPHVLARRLGDHPRRVLVAAADTLRRGWLPALGLTAAFWLLHVACHYLMLLALGSVMDLPYFVLCLTLAGLVEFVPVTLCGLGTRELLLIHLFSRAGLDPDRALAFSLLSLVFSYLMTGIFTMGLAPFARDRTR